MISTRPVPRLDGPYDDELLEPAVPVIDGSLALAFPPPTRAALPLRLVPPAAGPVDAGTPTCRDRLADPGPWARRLAQAIAEVLAGARPPSQLGPVTTYEVLSLLERCAGRIGSQRGAPARQPVVASVHVSEPCDGIAEACAVVRTGARCRALALRLDGTKGRWICAAVQIG